MNDDQLILTLKAIGVLLFTILAAFQTVLASDLITAAIPAATTAIGLAALVWKLATDRTATQDATRQWVEQASRYEQMLNRADTRIASLEAENTALHLRLEQDDPNG